MRESPIVYLSYHQADTERVKEIYSTLSAAGYRPWMAERDLLPGMAWQSSINEAIQRAGYFLAILSEVSVNDDSSFTQQEWRNAVKIAAELPAGQIYLIPVRLDDVSLPLSLSHIQAVDLFNNDGWDRLLQAMRPDTLVNRELPEPPEDLISAIKSGNCVLFAGAGLSAQAGFPTWRRLVSNTLDWTKEIDLLKPGVARKLQESVDDGDASLAAYSLTGQLQSAGESEKLLHYLRETFLEERPLPEAHRLLARIPFVAALTPNYDDLLPKTFEARANGRVYGPFDADSISDDYLRKRFFVLKLYGKLANPRDMLFSPASYLDMLAANRFFADTMDTLFATRTLFFLGLSLDGIMEFLESIRLTTFDQAHYALVAVTGSAWETRAEQLRRRYNIHVLPFAASIEFPEVPAFIQLIVDRLVELEEVEGGESEEEEKRLIKRLQLTNIGPFDSLELDLRRQWTVLLGNNGVGKSNILKAIALAFCGKQAWRQADKMIKSGHDEATIVLEMADGERYHTTIRRSDVEPEIVSRPARPIDTKPWLAIGFPPLRSVGEGRPSGVQLPTPEELGRQARPQTSDLLPILSSDPDPRIDGLKQWIVNLDYQATKGGDTRMQDLFDDFSTVVDKLTENVSLRLNPVNPQTYQITVHTDDGDIPLELISQGSQSVIGWTGILLERLYELFGDEGKPREQPALVLVDELDAHMHPEWQQLIVSNLKELFPKAQFIVSTHSPLIVTGLERDEVLALSREREDDDDRSRIVIRRSKHDFRGWDADQILTGYLFDLDSTVDPSLYNDSERYTELAAKDERTPEEEKEMAQKAERLKIRLPTPKERERARLAFEMIEKALDQQLAEIPPEKRQPLKDEVKVQMQENVTGSRRPQ